MLTEDMEAQFNRTSCSFGTLWIGLKWPAGWDASRWEAFGRGGGIDVCEVGSGGFSDRSAGFIPPVNNYHKILLTLKVEFSKIRFKIYRI